MKTIPLDQVSNGDFFMLLEKGHLQVYRRDSPLGHTHIRCDVVHDTTFLSSHIIGRHDFPKETLVFA